VAGELNGDGEAGVFLDKDRKAEHSCARATTESISAPHDGASDDEVDK
jgi:hypothetical protein